MQLRTTMLVTGTLVAFALAAVPVAGETTEDDSGASRCESAAGTTTCVGVLQAKCDVKTYSTAGWGTLNTCINVDIQTRG